MAQSHGKRFAVEARAETLARLEEMRRKGMSVEEICVEARVSPATYFRWAKAASARDQPDASLATQRAEAAIEVLCTQAPINEADFLEAVFSFTFWLRWPTVAHGYNTARAASLAALWLPEYGEDATLVDLPPARLRTLARSLPIRRLVKPFDDVTDFSDFHYEELLQQPFTERDMLSQWACFLISGHLLGKKISIQKLHEFVAEEKFEFNFSMSEGVLRRYLHQNLSAMPFIFVEKYHSLLDWNLVPGSDDFIEKVSNLKGSKRNILDFMRMARWATDVLRRSLDPRLLAKIHFPVFPDHLSALPPAPSQPPQFIATLIKEI